MLHQALEQTEHVGLPVSSTWLNSCYFNGVKSTNISYALHYMQQVCIGMPVYHQRNSFPWALGGTPWLLN